MDGKRISSYDDRYLLLSWPSVDIQGAQWETKGESEAPDPLHLFLSLGIGYRASYSFMCLYAWAGKPAPQVR